MKARFLMIALLTILGWNGVSAKQPYAVYKSVPAIYNDYASYYDIEVFYYNNGYFVNVLTFYYEDEISDHNSYPEEGDWWVTTKYLDTFFIDDSDEYPDWYGKNVDIVVFDTSFSDYHPKSTKHWFDGLKVSQFSGTNNLNTTEITDMSYMFANCSSAFFPSNLQNVTDMSYSYDGVHSLQMNDCVVNSSVNTDHCFKNLTYLKIDSSQIVIPDDFFKSVQSVCTLRVPDDFDFGREINGGNIIWKGGLFYIPPKSAYVLCTKKGWVDQGEAVGYFPTEVTFTFCYDNHEHYSENDIEYFPYDEWYVGNYVDYQTYSLNDWDTHSDWDLPDFHIPRWFVDFSYIPSSIETEHGIIEFPDYYRDEDNPIQVKIIIDPSFANYRPKSTNGWFQGLTRKYEENGYEREEDIPYTISGLEYLNTSEVTDMRWMFACNYHLSNLDLSHFDTSNVTNMRGMFCECWHLTSLDLSNFDTSKVTDMSWMFCECGNLTSLDLSNFDTSNVTDMSYMFDFCGLQSLDVISFNTSKVTNMSCMFRECGNLTSLNLSNFDTSNVTDMSWMFCDCWALTSLDLSNFDTSKVTNMSWMFNNCQAESIDLSSFNTSNVTDMSGMFYWINLETLNLSNFDLSKLTHPHCEIFSSEFPSSIKKLYISSKIENLDDDTFISSRWEEDRACMIIAPDNFNFDVDTSEEDFWWKSGHFYLPPKGDRLYAILRDSVLTYYYDDYFDSRTGNKCLLSKNFSRIVCSDVNKTAVRDIIFGQSSWGLKPQNINTWFTRMNNLVSISHLDKLDLSEMKDMSGMFQGCGKLKELDLSTVMTDQVTNMYNMFMGCSSLTTINFGHFNTSKVTDMSGMFSYCSNLTTLDVSNFDTGNVTNMAEMFSNCANLTSLDVSHFDTGNVITMAGMFSNCSNLTSLDVSNFDTGNVTTMAGMFSNCSNLTSLDASHFDTGNVTNIDAMFKDCSRLTTIDVSDFNTSNVTSMADLFNGCSQLTSLNLSHFDTSKAVATNSTNPTKFMMKNCSGLRSLYISSTMGNLSSDACSGIKSQYPLCLIYAPNGFDFGVDTSQEFFNWKGGWFMLGQEPTNQHVVGDTIVYAELKYLVTKVNTNNNEVMLIKNPTAEGVITIPVTITDENGYYKFSVTAIEDRAFYNCAELTSLTIPASVTSIGSAVTSCCTILGSITVVEDNPIYDSRDNCNAIIERETGRLLAGCNNTVIPEGVTAICTEAMRGMYDLKDITLPSTLKAIEGSAFYYCTSLKNDLRIPEGVTSIGNYAFYKCTGLTSLYIPSTITSLGTYAFRECTGLTTVRCRIATPPSINARTFANYANCTLMVPSGSVEAYKAAPVWKTFKNIVPITDLGDVNQDGSVDISDVLATVDYILGKNPVNYIKSEGDINGDNEINISDVLCIVDIILGKSTYSAPANARMAMMDNITLLTKNNTYTLCLDNHEPYSGFQMRLSLPEGCTLRNASLMADRSDGHRLVVRDHGDGTYTLIAYAPDGSLLRDNGTPLLRLTINGAHTPEDIQMTGILFSTPQLETVILPDVNGSVTGIMDIATDQNDNTAPAYNMQGQRVSPHYRGLVIKNGEKRVVK